MPVYFPTGYNLNPPLSLPEPCFSFDIDGTLANGLHRVHYIELKNGRSKKDWPAYFAELDKDAYIEPVCEAARNAAKAGHPVIYMTARPEEYITRTAAWLAAGDLPLRHPIFYRKSGDFRPDDVVKLELFHEAELLNYKILMHYDDRRRVVVALRNGGYMVAAVDEGDY